MIAFVLEDGHVELTAWGYDDIWLFESPVKEIWIDGSCLAKFPELLNCSYNEDPISVRRLRGLSQIAAFYDAVDRENKRQAAANEEFFRGLREKQART